MIKYFTKEYSVYFRALVLKKENFWESCDLICGETHGRTLLIVLAMTKKIKMTRINTYSYFNKKDPVNTGPFLQGMRDSNPHRRFWRPVLYHWTNPLLNWRYVSSKLHIQNQNHFQLYRLVLPTLPFLPRFHTFGQDLDRLVAVSSIHCCTSTPALSTSSSSRGLTSFEWDISSWGGLHA